MTRRILFVCTANVCRSPMAAGLLADQLATLSIPAAIASAGTRRFDLGVDPHAVDAVTAWGVDISAHQPRRIDRTIATTDGADLIVTMTREQLRDVASMERTAWRRTFTLKELVRRASAAEANRPWDEWLAELGTDRRPSELLGDDPHDDISDPYGLGPRAVAATAAEIRELTDALARMAPWPAG